MKKKIFNGIFLYGLQAITLILPFLAIPRITEYHDKELVGQFLICLSLIQWLSIIIEYGFQFSFSRSYVRNKENINDIATSIIATKFILLFLSVLIFLLINYNLITTSSGPMILSSCLLIPIYGFNSSWYYLAVGRVREYSKIEGLGTIVFLVAFIVLSSVFPEYVLYEYVFLMFFCKGFSSCYLYYISGLEFNKKYCGLEFVAKQIGDSFYLFLYRISSGIMSVGFGFFISFLLSPIYAGYYIITDKIVRAAISLYGPFCKYTLPIYLKNQKNKWSIWIVFSFLITLSVVMGGGIFVFKENVMEYFNIPVESKWVEVLSFHILLLLSSLMSILFSDYIAIAKGYDKYLILIPVFKIITFMLLIIPYFYFVNKIYLISIAYFFSEIFSIVLVFILVKKYEK